MHTLQDDNISEKHLTLGLTGSNRSDWDSFNQKVPLPDLEQQKLFPDFLVVSPAKTGSTWLAANLANHEGINFSDIKEIKYLCTHWRWFDLNWYLGHFKGKDGLPKGEATPTYALLPKVAIEYLRRAKPDLKVIFLLRHPIERAWSQARHDHMFFQSNFKDNPPPLSSVTVDQWRQALIYDLSFQNGFYNQSINRWLEVFPAEQIFIGFDEEIKNDPIGLFKRVCSFIGAPMPDNFDTSTLTKKIGEGVSFKMPPELKPFIRDILAVENRELVKTLSTRFNYSVPDSWRDCFERFQTNTTVFKLPLGNISFSENVFNLTSKTGEHLCSAATWCELLRLVTAASSEEFKHYSTYMKNLSTAQREELQLKICLEQSELFHPLVYKRHNITIRGNIVYGLPHGMGAWDPMNPADRLRPEVLRTSTVLEMMQLIDKIPNVPSPKKEKIIDVKLGSQASKAEDEYTKIDRYLDRGDFVRAAMFASDSDWRKAAALGMLGQCDLALSKLANNWEPRVVFYRGVINWINGDDKAAIYHLSSLSDQHARNLINMINRQHIDVLAHVRPLFWGEEAQDKKFNVHYIYHNNEQQKDAPIARVKPGQSLAEVVPKDFIPAFFLTHMVEFSYLSPDFHRLACPKFAASADYDLHLHTVADLLPHFDEIIAPTPAEWDDLHGLTGLPVSTFPKMYGSSFPNQPIPPADREIDVYMSGTLMSPYMAEKAGRFLDVLRQSDLNFKFVNGFTNDYLDRLAKSKATWTGVRRDFSMPWRGVQSLGMGCSIVCEPRTTLTLWADETKGLFIYEDTPALVKTLKEISKNWMDIWPYVYRGAQTIRQEFELKKTWSQYLRFLTYLAARPRKIKQSDAPINPRTKEIFYVMGENRKVEDRNENLAINLASLGVGYSSAKSPKDFIEAARSGTLALCQHNSPTFLRLYSPWLTNKNIANVTLDIYQTGLERYPNSLVLAFNYLRHVFHSGTESQVSQALIFARKVVNSDPNSWQVDPKDDVLPLDFAGVIFDYRKYLITATAALKSRQNMSVALIGIIRASIFAYLGSYTGSARDWKAALDLNPEFDPYKLKYAASLIPLLSNDEHKTQNLNKIIEILESLAENSILFEQATNLLGILSSQGLYGNQHYYKFQYLLNKYKNLVEDNERVPWNFIDIKPALYVPEAL